jgi:PAS domain S-box-containing protein
VFLEVTGAADDALRSVLSHCCECAVSVTNAVQSRRGMLARPFRSVAHGLSMNRIDGDREQTLPTFSNPSADPLIVDSTDWLRVTLSSIGDGVITTDPAGRVTFMNPVAETLTGWTLHDATEAGGVPIELVFNIVDEDSGSTLPSPTLRALQKGEIVALSNHTVLIARNGTQVHITDSAAPIRNLDGRIAGAVLVFRDVSEQKAQSRTVRDAKEFAENILESQRDSFLVLDSRFRVVSANRAFYKWFQVTPEQTQGRLVYELGNGQWNIPKLRELLEDILPKHGPSVENFQVEHDLEMIGRKVMSLNARCINRPGNHAELILLGIEDITARTRRDKLLASQKAILELAAGDGPLERVFQLVVRAAQEHSGERSGAALFLVDPEGLQLRLVAWSGIGSNNADANAALSSAPCFPTCGHAASKDPIVIISDISKDARCAPCLKRANEQGIRACWSHTIRIGDGRVLGTIATYSTMQSVPGQDEIDAVAMLSDTVAIVIERQRELEQRVQTERTLRESEGRYRTLLTSIDEGFCIIEVLFDEKQTPIDYRFLEVNPTFGKQSGLEDAVGKTMRELRPMHDESWFQILGQVASSGEPIRFIKEARQLAGQWYDVYACRVGEPESRKVAIVFNDITERNQSQEALRDSHVRFETLFDTSPVGMYVVDDQFRLWKMNAKTRATFGGFKDQIGTDFTQILHVLWPPEIADEIAARFRHTVATGEPYRHAELAEVRSDREVREYYDWELHRISLPQGQHGVVCYFLDISAQVHAQQAVRESETRYRRLFEAAKDGILILDAKTGKITAANAFMCNLTGMKAEEFLGKELYEIGMFKDTLENKAAFHDLQTTGYFRHEHLPLHNLKGEEVEVEFVANLYSEGDRLVAQCNIRDISERSRLEKTLAAQAEALTVQARSKDEFLAMLSHELRNPLAPIRAAAHMMRLQEQQTGTEANPILQQAREVIERQVANLTKMVSDLSEVSRVISGRIRLETQPVDLKRAIGHAIQTVTPIFEQREHAVSVSLCTEPLWALADPVRLEEILVNVLNNAAKYTPDGGRVDVTCEHARDGDQTFGILRVRDNGVGIDEALLPRVFDLFTQADRSLARSSGGLGIGLSLARRLVVLHEGTIQAQSDGPGKGSEFSVRMPLITPPRTGAAAVASTRTETASPSAAASKTGKNVRPAIRVLVVDDNVDLVTMLCGALRHQGYIVQSAHTGPDGLRLAQQWQPDIAILDIGLPSLDGYQIARRLRAEQSPQMNTPGGAAQPAIRMKLIAITGYGRDEDIVRAREAGFDGHMVKPCDLEKLELMMTARSLSI